MPDTNTTPRRAVKSEQLTTGELKATLRATSWLLGDVMRPKINDQLLLSKLDSLHIDLLAEEEDRQQANSH